MAVCPNCNYNVDDHADVCGNCGTPMKRRGGFVQIAPSGTYGGRELADMEEVEHDRVLADLERIERAETEAAPTPTDEQGFAVSGHPGGLGGPSRPHGFAPPNEPGGTFIPVAPLARRRSILPALAVLLVLGVAGAIFFFAGGLIDKATEEVNKAFDEISNPGTTEETEEDLPAGSYNNVTELVADLEAGGFPCKKLNITLSDEFSNVGTCTPRSGNGFPLTIMMFFDALSIDATRDGFATAPAGTSFYVHDANWFVFAPTPKVAKQVHGAIGGELHK